MPETGTATDHRQRLIAAMSESVADKGYRDTTVADVVRIARTSQCSFYEHFEDRDACYLALFDAVNDALMATVAAAINGPGETRRCGRGACARTAGA